MHKWKFSKVGGVTSVSLESGEDLARLSELDQKMWTALSCPVSGLEIDAASLKMLDADGDGKIRAHEVGAMADWLKSVLKDMGVLTARSESLRLDSINDSCEEGKRLLDSARRVLSTLGKADADSISVADTSDSLAIFAATTFNGDGVITPDSTTDESLKKTVEAVMATTGKVADRSGKDGVAQEQVDAFYTALADYAAWAAEGKGEVLPYGADTAAAYAACTLMDAKVSDFFLRCSLVSINGDAAASLDFTAERIAAFSAADISVANEKMAELPLARVNAEGVLPIGGAVNPAWAAQFASLKSLVLDKEFAGKTGITSADWAAVMGKFAPYVAWTAAKKGESVENLGAEAVAAFLNENRKADIDALIAQDKALETEFNDIRLIDTLVHMNRDFSTFVHNFVNFADFYKPEVKAIFQAGTLYIDHRSCDLCVKVSNMDNSGSIAALSGMYVVYCDCSSKDGAGMTIAAVVTGGETDDIRVGKNAIFYDRSGADWDATVVKIIENPISIRQAFLSPYRKIGRFITDKINGIAAKQDSKALNDATAKIETAGTAAATDAAKGAEGAKGKSFDIATFAGIFAAIGMAIGYIGQLIKDMIAGATASPLKALVVIMGIILVISLPSMFLAWMKLRKRNISPMLNVNGWALNSRALVNTNFGATLTKLAHFPMVKARDPFAPKKKGGAFTFLLFILLAAAGAALALHLRGVI